MFFQPAPTTQEAKPGKESSITDNNAPNDFSFEKTGPFVIAHTDLIHAMPACITQTVFALVLLL